MSSSPISPRVVLSLYTYFFMYAILLGHMWNLIEHILL